MGAEFLSAILGGAAITYAVTDLIRGHVKESRREHRIAVRQKELDEKYVQLVATSPSGDYSGTIWGVPVRRMVGKSSLIIAMTRRQRDMERRIRQEYQTALTKLIEEKGGEAPFDPADKDSVQRFVQSVREEESERPTATR